MQRYSSTSLVSTTSKTVERALYKRIDDHVISKTLILDHKFGFRINHGTMQQVLKLAEELKKSRKNSTLQQE